MSLVVYLNSVNSTKFDQPMYTVIHMQDPGSVRDNQDHGSLASWVGSRVTSLPGQLGSRVSVADPVPSLVWGHRHRYHSIACLWFRPMVTLSLTCAVFEPYVMFIFYKVA